MNIMNIKTLVLIHELLKHEADTAKMIYHVTKDTPGGGEEADKKLYQKYIDKQNALDDFEAQDWK